MRVEFNPNKIDVLLFQLAGYSFMRKFLRPTDIVLDVGCGEGYTTKFLSEKCAIVVGIDSDEKIIDENMAKYDPEKTSFKYCYPLPSAEANYHYRYDYFNVVICRDLIEHLSKNEGEILIKKLSEVLRHKSSILFLGTPRKNVVFNRPEEQGHIHEYTHHELKTLLERYFERVVFFSQTDEVVSLLDAKEMCWRWIVMCWGKKK